MAIKIDDQTLWQLKTTLSDAKSDLRQWVRLAKKQRRELPHNTPCCPTMPGIDTTELLIERLSVRLRRLLEIEKES